MSRLVVMVGVLSVCVPLCAFADAGIFAFVDEADGIHLSNVPADDRYEILLPAPAPATADASAASAAPEGTRGRYDALIHRAALRVGIDPALLHAVITVESGYRAQAVSARGAAGLMQLMPGTAARYGVADIFDPADNILAGAKYLADLLAAFDSDLRLALAAYNAGEAAVLKYGRRVPPYRETAAYVPKVVSAYRRYRSSM